MKKVSRRATKLEMVLRDKPEITVGLDLGDRFSRYCFLSAEGEEIEEGRMASNKRGCGDISRQIRACALPWSAAHTRPGSAVC